MCFYVQADNNENDYTEEDKMMMSGEDAIPSETKNLSTKPGEIKLSSGFCLLEVRGDLFSAPSSSSLCHCVSRDFRLGKGIAKLFREKFGRIDELKSSGARVGEVAVLKEKKRFIYNLVTKEIYSGKPTYETLRRSLEEMKDHARANGVSSISMPLIGCGLDGLSWPAVRTLVKNVFLKENLTITVYSLDQGAVPASSSPSGGGSKNIAEMFKKGNSKKSSKGESKTPQSTSSQSHSTSLGFGFCSRRPLPEVLVGLKVHLAGDITDRDRLERYLVSYGGKTVAEYQLSLATHIVYSNTNQNKLKRYKEAKHVTEQWLVDSLKMKKIQDERLYRIK